MFVVKLDLTVLLQANNVVLLYVCFLVPSFLTLKCIHFVKWDEIIVIIFSKLHKIIQSMTKSICNTVPASFDVRQIKIFKLFHASRLTMKLFSNGILASNGIRETC